MIFLPNLEMSTIMLDHGSVIGESPINGKSSDASGESFDGWMNVEVIAFCRKGNLENPIMTLQ